jgi:hypothetical protein
MSEEIEKLNSSNRTSCKFKLAAEYLDLKHEIWTEDERQNGTIVRVFEAVPDDESAAIREAARSGSNEGASIALVQIKLQLASVGGRPVNGLNRDVLWRAVSPRGRSMILQQASRMNRVSAEAVRETEESFCMEF